VKTESTKSWLFKIRHPSICNNCKYFQIEDISDLQTGISSEKFGIGYCHVPSDLLYTSFTRRSQRARRFYRDDCTKFKFDIHQKFGIEDSEFDDMTEYAKYFNEYKIISIRDIQEQKELDKTWDVINRI
jgi:hypothetical protein